MATDPSPSSRRVRKTRIAISPRLATRTLSNMSEPYSPHSMSPADQLTVARALSVPIVIVLYAWDFDGHAYWATAVFCIAMTTDFFDGKLARRHGRSSPLGSLLDPIADKVLVLGTMVMLVGLHVVPGWMIAAIVVR